MRINYFHSWGYVLPGHMEVYYESSPPAGGMHSGMPNAPGFLSFMAARSLVGAGRLLYRQSQLISLLQRLLTFNFSFFPGSRHKYSSHIFQMEMVKNILILQ